MKILLSTIMKFSKQGRPLQALLFFIFLSVLACTVLDPESLTLEQERQFLLDDILRRDKSFRVRHKDEQSLIALLNSEDSRLRLAVVKLMRENSSSAVYNALVAALTDEDPAVSSEASSILLEQWDAAANAVLRGLLGRDSARAGALIRLIRLRRDSSYAPYLLMVQDDSPSGLKDHAAWVYGTLGSFNSSGFQRRLNSPVGRIRRSAVETIPAFRDPRLIPFLMNSVSDPDPSVVSAALFGISGFGGEALPYIEKALKEKKDRVFRLKLLELINGELDPDSIPLLLDLLGDEDSSIARRAEGVLLRMGPQALPFLVQRAGKKDFQGREAAIRLIQAWKDPRGIPFLVQVLDSKDEAGERLAGEAEKTLLSFGDRAYEALGRVVDEEGGRLRFRALELLVGGRVPFLVRDREGAYSVNRILYLFESLDKKRIEAYLEETSFSTRERRDLKRLYNLELNAAGYDQIRKISSQETFPYFFALRNWERASLAAEISRKNSFDYIHYYFVSDEDSWLGASRQSRDSYDDFSRDAEEALKKALMEENTAGKEDMALAMEYLSRREALVEGWRNRGRRTKDIILLIFLNYSLDIQEMVRDYDYFRTLPPEVCPWPAFAG